MFEELSDIFSDHDNYLTSRELLMKVRMRLRARVMSCVSAELRPFPNQSPKPTPRLHCREPYRAQFYDMQGVCMPASCVTFLPLAQQNCIDSTCTEAIHKWKVGMDYGICLLVNRCSRRC